MNKREFLGVGLGAAGAVLSSTAALAQTDGSAAGAAAAEAAFRLDARRTAFINVDMQNWFVEGYPVSAADGPALLRRINGFAGVCRAAGIRVIHTAHVLRADGSNAGLIPQSIQVMIRRGALTSMLHKDLVIDPRDVVLEKPRFGAFQGTDLELILRGNGIDSVIIGGIATNVCCETTAREAGVRDFHVFFLSDGTSPYTFGEPMAAEIQKATCMTLQLFGDVLTIDQMIARIGGAQKGA